MTIPCVLLFFVKRRQDVPFHKVFYLFGLFILTCGITHLIDATMFTWPAYRLLGVSKAITATASWLTVMAMIPIIPRALELPGVMRLNDRLTREIEERTRAQIQLAEHAEALEQANRRLAELTSEAEAANRAKSDFLAHMSHEIRTPMTAILGYSDELLREVQLGDETSRLDALQTIRENGEHLLDIVNDVLDLSRIEAGRLEVDRRSVELSRILAEVESLIGVLVRRKGLSLQVCFEGNIPERIETDAVRLKQVLVNLVSNAVKYSDQGTVSLTVRLLPGQPDPLGHRPLLEFEVADTGVGMTPDEVSRLFIPYSRLDRRDDPRGSTGLGLTISQRLVELLGGQIQVTSVPNAGTTVSVTIDPGELDGIPEIKRDPPPTASPTSSPDTTSAEGVELPEGLRVLLAEDTVSNQRLIGRILAQARVCLDVVNDGVEAVEAVQRSEAEGKDYHVILMDMLMPNLGGLDAAARLRALGCRTPIVALTANVMDGDRERYLRSGCDGYLGKPIHRDQLLSTLARFGQPGLKRSTGSPPSNS